jgi:hypothetical protein
MKPSQAYVGSLKDKKKLAPVEKKETFEEFVKMLREFRLILGVPQHVPMMK